MALGTATLLTPTISSATGTATSASFTPSANQTIYAAGTSRRTLANGAATQPAIVDSLGSLTWTPIDEATLSGATANLRLRVWRTTVGSSPLPMTVSISGSGTETHSVTLLGITGAGTDDSNRITGTNATGDPALTLPSTPGATSATIGFCFCNSTGVVTQPAGYTELEDISTGNGRMETVALAGNTATGLTWASANNDAVAFAMEVKPSATVQVSQTLDLRRAIFVPVTKTLDLRRAIFVPASRTLDLRRAVLSSVSRSLDLRRAVAALATRTLDLRRLINVQASRTLDLRRAVLGPVTKTLDLRRAILSTISRTIDLRRAVFLPASRTLDLRRQINVRVVSTLELERSSENLPKYVHRGGGPAFKPKKKKPEPEPTLPPVTHKPPAKEPDLRLPPILPFTDAERVFLANRRAAEKVVQRPPGKALPSPSYAVIQPRMAAPPPHPMAAMTQQFAAMVQALKPGRTRK
jgi:hypothetical protein